MTSDAGPAARRDESDAVPAAPSGSSRWRSFTRVGSAIAIAALIAITGLLWSRTTDLQDTVAALQRDARAGTVDGARSDAAAIKALTRCVNTYMKTIGDWSSNVTDRYNYNFC